MAVFFAACALALLAAGMIPARSGNQVNPPVPHGNEMHYDFR